MKAICKICTVFILNTVCTSQSIAQQHAKQKLFSRIDSIVKAGMGNVFPSITLAVVIDGKVAYTKAYGFANKQKKIRATTKTCYQIGSLTKTFTGNLLARLVVHNKV